MKILKPLKKWREVLLHLEEYLLHQQVQKASHSDPDALSQKARWWMWHQAVHLGSFDMSVSSICSDRVINAANNCI